MGNVQKRPSDFSIVNTYDPHLWTKDSTSSHLQVWRNKSTQERVQVHQLPQVPSIEDMTIFDVRSRQPYLVRVINIAMNDKQVLCVTNTHAQLLLEYIPIRLAMISNLDLQEAITTMHAAFKGFNIIEGLLGPVEINQELIGFNDGGKPKVWLNSSFYLNRSQIKDKSIHSSQSERVRQIFRMIQSKIKGQAIDDDVKWALLNNVLNYENAIIVLQQYAHRNELSLKRYVRVDLLERKMESKEMSKLTRNNSTSILTNKERINAFEENRNRSEVNQMSSFRSEDSRHISEASATVGTPFKPAKLSYGQFSFDSSKKVKKPPSPLRKLYFKLEHRSAVLSPRAKLSNDQPPQYQTHRPTPTPKVIFNQPVHPQEFKPSYGGMSTLVTSPRNHTPLHKVSTTNQINFKIQGSKLSKPVIVRDPPISKQTSRISQSEQNQEGRQKSTVKNQQQVKQYIQAKYNAQNVQKVHQKIGKQRSQHSQLQQQQQKKQLNNVAECKGYDMQPDDKPLIIPRFDTIIDRINDFRDEEDNKEPNGPALDLKLDSKMYPQPEDDVRLSGGFIQIQQGSIEKEDQVMQINQPVANKVDVNQQRIKNKSDFSINFESFGVNLLPNMQNFSFAPSIEPHLPAINQRTSQSIDVEQRRSQEEESSEGSSIVLEKNNIAADKFSLEKGQVQIQFRAAQQKEEEAVAKKKQIYKDCIPVQSEFHIEMKKESHVCFLEPQKPLKISAVANLDHQDSPQQLVVDRVSSQYQNFYERNSEFSQRIRSSKPLKNGGNYSTHRSYANKGITEEDPLDVKFLQKSLDLKYNSSSRKERSVKQVPEDKLQISRMDEQLSKFQMSQRSANKSRDQEERPVKKQQCYPSQHTKTTDEVVPLIRKPSIQLASALMIKQNDLQVGSSDGFLSSFYQKQTLHDYIVQPSNHQKSRFAFDSKAEGNKISNKLETDGLKCYRSVDHNRYKAAGTSYRYDAYTSGQYRQGNNRHTAYSTDKDKQKLELRYQKYVKSKNNKDVFRNTSENNNPFCGYTTPQKLQNKTIISEYQFQEKPSTLQRKGIQRRSKLSYEDSRFALGRR